MRGGRHRPLNKDSPASFFHPTWRSRHEHARLILIDTFRLFDDTQELDELSRSMSAMTLADHMAVLCVERREERGRSMPCIVVRSLGSHSRVRMILRLGSSSAPETRVLVLASIPFATLDFCCERLHLWTPIGPELI